MTLLTLATTQMPCTWDLPHNLDQAEQLVREAAAKGAQVILLQELFATPYFCIEQSHKHLALAEEYRDSSVLKRFAALAKELGVVLPLSWFEKAGNAYFNSLSVADADGRLLGVYRKTHIPNAIGYQEKEYFSPGDTGFRVWDTAFGRLGVGICWDQWFPETARCLALMGAEVLLFPTAIGSEPGCAALDSRDHWQMTMRGHAAANLLPVLASNRVGREAATTDPTLQMSFYGSSFICNHKGKLLAEADRDSTGVLVHSLDLSAMREERLSWGIYRDRRPDMYGALLSQDGRHLHSRWATQGGLIMRIANHLLLAALTLACAAPSLHAEEKTLRLYNWADYFAEDTLSKFTAETGIKVIYDVMDGSETLEAKMLAGGSGYDLIFPGDTVSERLMRAGSLLPLDHSKLTALDDIEPGLQQLRTHYEYSGKATVPYTWGTIGLTYNAEQIKQRLPDAPVNSLDLLFKPELAAKFADCGISMIDSPDEVLAVVLNYLGRDPRSAKPQDLAAASELLMKLRPYIRKFQSQPVTDLVNGNLCLSLGYSGDMTQAQRTSDSAGKSTSFQYRIPREGTTVWMDTMAIPVDAKHPEYAYAFINFVMRPENMAAISNFTGYPTSNAKARPSVDAAMRNNPDIYLDEATYARLIPGKDIPQSDMRARMRTWTKFKTATAK